LASIEKGKKEGKSLKVCEKQVYNIDLGLRL